MRRRSRKNVHGALSEAEWITLMFFLGLFVLVFGIQKTGLIDMMADALLKATGGDFNVTALAILWASAILSAFIDNIPFVATMIPLIKAMGPTFGGDERAAAAVVGAVARRVPRRQRHADRRVGQPRRRRASPSARESTFRFIEYLKVAFPLMLISIVLSHVYIYYRFRYL